MNEGAISQRNTMLDDGGGSANPIESVSVFLAYAMDRRLDMMWTGLGDVFWQVIDTSTISCNSPDTVSDLEAHAET